MYAQTIPPTCAKQYTPTSSKGGGGIINQCMSINNNDNKEQKSAMKHLLRQLQTG